MLKIFKWGSIRDLIARKRANVWYDALENVREQFAEDGDGYDWYITKNIVSLEVRLCSRKLDYKSASSAQKTVNEVQSRLSGTPFHCSFLTVSSWPYDMHLFYMTIG